MWSHLKLFDLAGAETDFLVRQYRGRLGEGQIERLNECFSLLGETARTKPCKGMMGLVEEGQEVMAEGEEKEDALADFAMICAARRVEHYEISGYTTAKNLAQQARHSAVVALPRARAG